MPAPGNGVVYAMAVLQDLNGRVDTTFALLRGRIETMPVWQGNGAEIRES